MRSNCINKVLRGFHDSIKINIRADNFDFKLAFGRDACSSPEKILKRKKKRERNKKEK